jgi:hypothetical protein
MRNAKYGKLKPVKVHRGKIHDYLEMTLDYSEDKKCRIRMDNYVDQILEETPSCMERKAETPAGENLFETNPICGKLNADSKEVFHTLVAKMLFLAKLARPDILTAVSYLCKRTQAPIDDDWKKLTRLVRYLRKYPHLRLALEVENPGVARWSVDASFGVHGDMRSHTGICGTLGKGTSFSGSSKQKLNTRSSTESEVVGADDAMNKVIRTRLFLEQQGYDVGKAIIEQDNKSAILLENNGAWSSTRRTRHLNMRLFFLSQIGLKRVSSPYSIDQLGR